MTDQTDALPEPQWGPAEEEPNPHWGPALPVALPGSPAYPYQLADHRITISFTPKKEPMVVVRANSATEANALFEELEAENVYGVLASAQHALLSSAPAAELIMRELGGQPMQQQYHPQQPSAAAQQVAQAYPTPANGFAGPPVPSPGPPPFGAPAGGYQMPQPQWGGGQPSARPAGWYAVKIPFAAKAAGDAVKNQLKAQGLYQGNVRWESESKTWLVSPAVVQAFAQWNPVPA